MLPQNSLRRFEIPAATGSSRIVTLPIDRASATGSAQTVTPKTLVSFEDALRSALEQTSIDSELNRLFDAGIYEI